MTEQFTITEACARLRISKSCLRALLERHKLPVIRLGRKLMIPTETLDEIVRIGTMPFTPHPHSGYRSHGGRPRKQQ